jgi:hypothetical protein
MKEFADTEAATDYLLRRGYIDRKRLVATGGSYGGYMVAYMNGHTDRYRTYVCHAGCYDWVSMMATDGYHFFAEGARRISLERSGAGDAPVAAPLRASARRRRRSSSTASRTFACPRRRRCSTTTR